MKEIPLTQGRVAIVDDVDFEYLSQWKWCYTAPGYVVRRRRNAELPGSRRIYLHRVVARPLEDEVVDHINRNKLDNRRANLRCLRDQSLNLLNQGISKKNKTGVKGVVRLADKKRSSAKFAAYLSVKNKTHFLGHFDTLEEAERARINASMEYHGVHYKN